MLLYLPHRSCLFLVQYSLGNPPLLRNWTGDAPCNSSWPGVTCNSTTGASAVAVNASRVQAYGNIPAVIGGLTGLQTLDLSYNNIFGEAKAPRSCSCTWLRQRLRDVVLAVLLQSAAF